MSKPVQSLRTFYIIILTQTFSIFGSQISGLAISIWVYQETGNATPLALVAFFAVLPSVVAAGISGVLSDRWDRRYVMALADAGQAVGTILLLLSFTTGNFQLWHLYVASLIQAAFEIFQRPALAASITMLIPEERRERANAIQRLSGSASGLIAPSLAAIIYVSVGIIGAILVDLVTFAVAFVVILNARIPHPKQTEVGKSAQGSIWKEMMSGFRFLWDTKPLLNLMILTIAINFFLNGLAPIFTPYILARTSQNEAVLGITLGMANAGVVVGGVIIGIWGGTRPRMNTLLPAFLGTGLFMILFGMSQNMIGLAVTVFLMMVAVSFLDVMYVSIRQVKVPPDMQGRFIGAFTQVRMLVMPLAYLLVGPLVDHVFELAVELSGWDHIAPLVGNGTGAGMGLLFVLSGGLLVICTLIAVLAPSIRNLEAILADYKPITKEK